MKNRLALFIVTLIVTGCTKEEVTPRVFPRVNTIQVTNITSGGATFKAEITFSSVPMVDHGFIWSKTGVQSFPNSDKISLGSRTGAGDFEATVDRSLEEGVKYYVRAYAISEDHTVFGKAVEFVSLGSKAPVFEDFFPTLGTWDDTVTIVGENFSQVLIENEVKFSGNSATVIKASPDTLQVLVPFDLNAEFSTLTLSLIGNSVALTKEFQLRAPIIESVTPNVGLPNSTVTISGKYLRSGTTKIYFGTAEASILNWSASKIDCKVPMVPNGDVVIKLVAGLGNLSATAPFKVQPVNLPQLTQIEPATAHYGETIKLKGDFFSPEIAENTVKFDDYVTTIVSASKTELEVIVPLPERRTPTISVTSYGATVSLDAFSMKPPNITGFTPHNAGPYIEVTITGDHFVFGSFQKVLLDDVEIDEAWANSDTELRFRVPAKVYKHSIELKVKFYDQELVLNDDLTSRWISVPDFPGSTLNSSISLVYNNMAYIGLGGGPDLSNQFWKFNPASKQWSRLNDFPGSKRYNSFSFTAGSKGYVGGGWDMEKSLEMWEYDFANDSWTQKSDIPFTGASTLGFMIGNEAFAVEHDYDASEFRLWKYDYNSDTWSLRTVCPMHIWTNTELFVIGNAAYFADGGWFYKYTPATNQWMSLGGAPNEFNFGFTLGGVGYAYGSNYFYKYNAATNTWTEDGDVYLSNVVPGVTFTVNGKAYIISGHTYEYTNSSYEFDPNF